MYELLDPPARAVEGGVAAYGLYKRPIPDLNLLDIDIFQRKRPSPLWLRRLRLKEWEHIGVLAESFYLGIAVVDAKFMGLSWACFFDRSTSRMVEHTRRFLPGHIRVPPALAKGDLSARGRRYAIDIHNRLDEGYHGIVVDIAPSGSLPRFHARLTLRERMGEVQPIIALLPIEERRPFFTHKAPCPVEGEVTIGDKRFDLDPGRDVAVLDYHRTYFLSRTHWEWATCAGFDKNGTLIGINLTRGILRRDELLNENGIWYGATLTPVGRAIFRIPHDPKGLWHIKTDDGAVDLTFAPRGYRSERIRIGPINSTYTQPFGLFSGKVRDAEGRIHTLEDLFGVAEDHTVTW
jgi:hypothetical protein